MSASLAPLERTLARFVDLAMAGDLDGARQAFADAQAHGLEEVGTPAALWAELERQAAACVPDDAGEARAAQLLARSRHQYGEDATRRGRDT